MARRFYIPSGGPLTGDLNAGGFQIENVADPDEAQDAATKGYVDANIGGGGVDSIAKSGDTPLTGDVTLSEGANVTLTQVGQDIEIAASSASGDVAGDTHAASSKATPVDADELPLVDSAASFVLKKLTWANLKATLKTYFDTLYQAAGTYVAATRTLTAGSGLSGGGDLSSDRTFDVNVDGSTIEIAADTLQLKDGGVTSAKIANGTIVDADVNASAAIAYSKLALSSSIVSGDIVDGTIVNGDINASAAIAYSKLNLASSIVTGDITDATIVTGDLASSAISALSGFSTGWTVIVKSGDETVAGSTSPQADDELTFTAASGGLYELLGYVIYVSASGGTTPDLKAFFGEDATVRGSLFWWGVSPTDAANSAALGAASGGLATFGTATTNRVFMFYGHYWGSGAATGLNWSQNTSSGAPNGTTVKTGSVLRYRRIL